VTFSLRARRSRSTALRQPHDALFVPDHRLRIAPEKPGYRRLFPRWIQPPRGSWQLPRGSDHAHPVPLWRRTPAADRFAHQIARMTSRLWPRQTSIDRIRQRGVTRT